jgi:hypothetical protein
MVRGTIFAIAKAFFFFKLFSASWTGPSYKTRREFYVIGKVMNVAIKFFDKVKCEYIVTTVPELDCREVIWVLHCEFS